MKTVKMTQKLHAYLGFAAKSGQMAWGNDKCEKVIKSGRTKLILISENAGINTKKHFSDMASFRDIPCALVENDSLGAAIGRDIKTVCITGEGFADAVIKEINLWGTENE